jgi:hypothetical protein
VEHAAVAELGSCQPALRERISLTLAMLPQARPVSPAYMLHQTRELFRDWS